MYHALSGQLSGGETPIIKSLAVSGSGLATLLAVSLLVAGRALAGPWLAPDDPALRDDLELLAETGALSIPVTTWPLSVGDLSNALEQVEGATLSAGQQAAVLRLRRSTGLHKLTGVVRRHIRLGAATEAPQIRNFTAAPREKAELGLGLDWTGLRFSYRLNLAVVADASDRRSVRADGSYAGVVLGNYMLSLGQVDRWWGPGHQGSLILSSNARPVPGITLQRNFSEPPSHRWLRWIGPWNFVTFMGQLEHDRHIPDALLFGMRFNFRPTDRLELGLSRTAQWCGDTRPCDLEAFADLLVGKDNRGSSVTFENEPGNQLAGVDWKWTLVPGWSWYGQVIGEDEAGGFPSRHIALSGLTRRVYSERWHSNIAWRLEYADTTVEFYKDQPRFDSAYEHSIYRDGYRYRGRPIGHTFDNDARVLALGMTVHRDNGHYWNATLRHAEVNTGGRRANSLTLRQLDRFDLDLSHLRQLAQGRLSAGVRLTSTDSDGATRNDIEAYAQWQGEW